MSPTAELILGLVSITTFVAMLVAVPLLVRRLPADYFVRPPPKHSVPMKIARNVVGAGLVAAGVAMLVLPGQGIVTILFGLSILDLPIKRRLLTWLLRRPPVEKAVQALRARAGKPPLVIPTRA